MIAEELEGEFEELLRIRRRDLAAQENDALADLDGVRDSRSAATADDEHDPEGSTLSEEWSQLNGRVAGSRARIVEIDAALERLAAGTYGWCQSCGRPIPLDRLRVRPESRLCVRCAS